MYRGYNDGELSNYFDKTYRLYLYQEKKQKVVTSSSWW